jgi:hypothetical protein
LLIFDFCLDIVLSVLLIVRGLCQGEGRKNITLRAYRLHKKVSGRKRHIAVDTNGRLLEVNLATADITDTGGDQTILETISKRWPWVGHLFGDVAYDRRIQAGSGTLIVQHVRIECLAIDRARLFSCLIFSGTPNRYT